MFKTSVFATDEEFMQIKNASIPFICGEIMTGTHVMGNNQRISRALEAQKLCHSIAMKHGLPEIPGFYGISHEKQFLSQYDVKEEIKT